MKRRYEARIYDFGIFFILLFGILFASLLKNAPANHTYYYEPPQQETTSYTYLPQQKPQKELKYNYFENRWEYAYPEEELKYNYMEDKWEYALPDERLKYNPFEDKWEY